MRRLTALFSLLLLCATTVPVAAQDASSQETINLFVGDIFEILPSHNLPNPTYTWILTQDRTFIEAGRAETFRKRLITPGRYTLYAEISAAGQNLNRTFILDYKARMPGQQPVAGSGSTDVLARTLPPLDEEGRTILSNGSQLLLLEPIDPDARPIIADLDLEHDADGDGDPGNDIDTDLTFFQTDATPLYVWFTQPVTTRSIALTVAGPEGARQQRIEVYGADEAAARGITRTPSTVAIEETGDRTFSFSAGFPANVAPGTPLLYHWEFGDGQQSLLANPTHEYAADGTYEVRLRIRDLTDGKEIAAYTEQIDVQGGAVTEPEPEAPEPEEPVAEPRGGVSIGSVLLLAGAFLGSILFGVGVIFVLSKLRGRGKSLSDTIEKMEETIVKKEEHSPVPPPLTINPPAASAPKPQTPPPEIAEREKERASENAAPKPTPKVEVNNAPAWLKSGLAGQTIPAPQMPAAQQPSAPKPQTPPRAAPPAPAPTPPQPAAAPPAPKPATPAGAPTPQPARPAQQAQAPAPAAAPTQTPPSPPRQQAPNQQATPTPMQPPMPPARPATPPQTPPPAQRPAQNTQQSTIPAWLQTPSTPAQPARPAPAPNPPSSSASPQQPPAPKPQSPANTAPAPAPSGQPQTPAVRPSPPTPPPTPPAPPQQQPTPRPQTPQAPSGATPSANQATPPNDQPVAFIRADSLEQPKPENGQSTPPQAG